MGFWPILGLDSALTLYISWEMFSFEGEFLFGLQEHSQKWDVPRLPNPITSLSPLEDNFVVFIHSLVSKPFPFSPDF